MVVPNVSRVFTPRLFPASKLLAAGSLCFAVAAVSQGWADDSHQNPASQNSAAQNAALGAGAAFAQVSRRETPAQFLFGSGQVEETPSGLQLLLKVPEGVVGDIEGVEQVIDDNGTSLITLSENHSEGFIESRNPEGNYGRLHVRRVRASFEDVLRPGPDAEYKDFINDDAYIFFRQLLRVFHIDQNHLARDTLLQAGNALIIRHADGSAEIQLYRRHGKDNSLDCLGQFLVDNKMNYELKGKIKEPEFLAEREAIINELKLLDMQINKESEQILQLMESGQHAGLQERADQVEDMRKRFDTLLREVGSPEGYEFFAVTETIDYEASHWIKMTDDSGVEVASQGVSYKIMGNLVRAKGDELFALTEAADLKTLVNRILDGTLTWEGVVKDGAAEEGYMNYLTRRLATAWAVIQSRFTGQAGGDIPPMYIDDPSMMGPVMRMQGVSLRLVNGLTVRKALDEMREVMTAPDKIQPDKFVVTDEQYREMKNALDKVGWYAWLKSFISPDAYQPSREATDLQDMLKHRGTGLYGLVQKGGLQGGLPVHVIDKATGESQHGFTSDLANSDLAEKARVHLDGDKPSILVQEIDSSVEGSDPVYRSEELTADVLVKIERQRVESEVANARKAMEGEIDRRTTGSSHSWANKAWGTVMAAGTGMATGYTLQRAVDISSTYYNEGVLPWDYTNKESERQNERAVKTGGLMAISGTINHFVLPRVAEANNYFTGVTGKTLLSDGLRGKFEASVAGGISGFAAHGLESSYRYMTGSMSASDLALDLADSAGRTVFTTAGSAVGHALLPYSFDVPYISTYLPIGFVGAVAGSMAGSALYDTAKHYTKAGAGVVSNYIYGSSSSADYGDQQDPSPAQDGAGDDSDDVYEVIDRVASIDS